ncbi:MAG: hypothetical protein II230_03285 [Clostridia bacterium]|nr:hypothetical protein [Clostridia bacterium]
MMRITLDPPAALHGTESEKFSQLYSYLFRLSETLNVALKAAETPAEGGKIGGEQALRAQLIAAEEDLQTQLRAQEEMLSGAIESAAKTAAENLAAHKNEPLYPLSVG